MKFRYLIICGFLLYTASHLSACSFFESAPETAPIALGSGVPGVSESSSKIQIEKLERHQNETADIEILWEAPDEPVDGYLIKYGFEKDKLNLEVRLALQDAERIKTEQGNEVLRYVIHKIPDDKQVYVSMSSIRGDDISPLSQVYEAK